MVHLGVLQREWDETDRRTIRIALSPRGKRLSQYHQEKTRALLQTLCQGLEEDEICSFLKVADLLNQRLWRKIREKAEENGGSRYPLPPGRSSTPAPSAARG